MKVRVAFEYNHGYSDLPPLYKKYFRQTLSTLLKRPVQHLKRWFLLICSIQESVNPVLVADRFLSDKALRRWVWLPIT